MEKEVKIADREYDTNILHIALNQSGLMVDYVAADLIKKTLDVLLVKGAEMQISDSLEIKTSHKEKWEVYFSQKSKENDRG